MVDVPTFTYLIMIAIILSLQKKYIIYICISPMAWWILREKKTSLKSKTTTKLRHGLVGTLCFNRLLSRFGRKKWSVSSVDAKGSGEGGGEAEDQHLQLTKGWVSHDLGKVLREHNHTPRKISDGSLEKIPAPSNKENHLNQTIIFELNMLIFGV